MLARVHTASLLGLTARPITVEVDLTRGLPTFHLVGLPDGAVRESRERVTAALGNSGFALPVRRITVSLAPADEPKRGSGFDLPIALAILRADGTLVPAAGPLAALGELALDGRVRPVRGVLDGGRRGNLMEVDVTCRKRRDEVLWHCCMNCEQWPHQLFRGNE